MLSQYLRELSIKILKRSMVVFVVFLACLVLLAVTPQGRTGARTMLILPELLRGTPLKAQEWITDSPSRREAIYPIGSGEGMADIYLPAKKGSHSAILLFLGVNPAGRDDPRVVGLATGLARVGIVVMIPWSDRMINRRIAVEEIENLVWAFQYLLSLDFVDPERAGIGGFCVGASLAIVAAADPRIHEKVQVVNSFGGYYDAKDLIKAVVTRQRFYGEGVQPWVPSGLSSEVVSTHLIETIDDPKDKNYLAKWFIHKKNESGMDIDLLSQEARVVYRLLNKPDIEEVDAIIRLLPSEVLETFSFISPSTYITELKAPVLIMHDREDSVVPVEESRRLVNSLENRKDTYYTEFAFFQHMTPSHQISSVMFVRESFKLFLHMYKVLRELS